MKEPRIGWLNDLASEEAMQQLFRCCGSRRWAEAMVSRRPFTDLGQLHDAADEIWAALEHRDWLEAFSHHPRIGADDSRQERFESTRGWSSAEQSGVDSARPSVRQRLRAANDAYYERFGYVFLICATGKSAEQMLAQAEIRLLNAAAAEIEIAAEEQRHITRLRLDKLLTP